MSKFEQFKQLFFIAAFLLLPVPLFSQNKIIDSLLLLLRNERRDNVKIDLNYKLAEQLTGCDVARAEKHLAEGYRLAKAGNDAYNIAVTKRILEDAASMLKNCLAPFNPRVFFLVTIRALSFSNFIRSFPSVLK